MMKPLPCDTAVPRWFAATMVSTGAPTNSVEGEGILIASALCLTFSDLGINRTAITTASPNRIQAIISHFRCPILAFS
jgi:hypothetical protein